MFRCYVKVMFMAILILLVTTVRDNSVTYAFNTAAAAPTVFSFSTSIVVVTPEFGYLRPCHRIHNIRSSAGGGIIPLRSFQKPSEEEYLENDGLNKDGRSSPNNGTVPTSPSSSDLLGERKRPLFGEVDVDGSLLVVVPAVVIAVLGIFTSILIMTTATDDFVDLTMDTPPKVEVLKDGDGGGCRGICTFQDEELNGLRGFMN